MLVGASNTLSIHADEPSKADWPQHKFFIYKRGVGIIEFSVRCKHNLNEESLSYVKGNLIPLLHYCDLCWFALRRTKMSFKVLGLSLTRLLSITWRTTLKSLSGRTEVGGTAMRPTRFNLFYEIRAVPASYKLTLAFCRRSPPRSRPAGYASRFAWRE